ncbi:MAG: hypothetical protein IIB38_14715 [Candidatus Hydrogenedentes bacterium]|nr:hypothetical protein [Candidatus Hydrogenedentota bacterium]
MSLFRQMQDYDDRWDYLDPLRWRNLPNYGEYLLYKDGNLPETASEFLDEGRAYGWKLESGIRRPFIAYGHPKGRLP